MYSTFISMKAWQKKKHDYLTNVLHNIRHLHLDADSGEFVNEMEGLNSPVIDGFFPHGRWVISSLAERKSKNFSPSSKIQTRWKEGGEGTLYDRRDSWLRSKAEIVSSSIFILRNFRPFNASFYIRLTFTILSFAFPLRCEVLFFSLFSLPTAEKGETVPEEGMVVVGRLRRKASPAWTFALSPLICGTQFVFAPQISLRKF